MMRVISLNVGRPRVVTNRHEMVQTGIFKTPVAGRVAVHGYNLDGDEQADLQVHGGPDKTIYAYPSEHYLFWQHELPEMELPWAMFGENLTTEGLLEDNVMIGDQFLIGTTTVMVTQPRLPCYKLDIRFGRTDMIKRFLHSGRTGFYFTVVTAGEMGAGDAITCVHHAAESMSVAEIVALYRDKGNAAAHQRAAHLPALAASMRDYFGKNG